MQPLLPTFEPSDNDLIEMALALPLDKKIEKAIEILRQYESLALKHNVMGYNLRFSSGKDSCVIDWLAKKAGIKHYKTYSNTTIDPPELVKFLKKHHPDAVWINSDHGHLILDRAVKKRNMPTRRGKWCCDEYKNCCSNTKCETSVKIIGVRISESAKRAGAWKTLTHTERGDIVVAPIAYWTDDDIWRCINENNIPYCELYDQGWSRLGCVGCPINPASQKKEFERWPKYKEMWQTACRKIWEISQTEKNTRGQDRYWKKFRRWEDMWDWWITGEVPQYMRKDTATTMELINLQGEADCVFEEMMDNT